MSGGSEIPEKRARQEKYCLIHCSDDDGALVCPNSVESWKPLRRAAEISRHEEILGITVNSPDQIPEVYYHRKCRSLFPIKKVSTEFMLMTKRRVGKIQNQLRVGKASEGHLYEIRRVLQGFMKRYAYFAQKRQNTRKDQGRERA